MLVRNFPTVQIPEQVEEIPVEEEYLPSSHTRHIDCPEFIWYFPASQAVQAVNPVVPAYDPALHDVQNAAPEDEMVPSWQLVQSVSASWFAAAVAGSERNFPAKQAVQKEAEVDMV